MMVISDKAWYGTAAASALWNLEITTTLVELCGYTQHHMVECLFWKVVKGHMCMILLHVDDLGVSMPPDNIERNRVCGILEDKYETLKKKEGDQVIYIGLEIRRCRTGNKFYVSMRERLAKLCEVHSVRAPIKTKQYPASNVAPFGQPTEAEDADFLPIVSITKYRSIVMSINYLTLCWPETKFYVSWLATRQTKPTQTDWSKVIYLLNYLCSHKDEDMCIGAMDDNPVIHVYADASFDVYKDSKSHSGITVFISGCNCAVLSTSNKQHCMARSSCDGEIITLESSPFLGS
jgi:hypothetical protein